MRALSAHLRAAERHASAFRGRPHGNCASESAPPLYARRMEDAPHPSRLAAWVRALGVLAAAAEQQEAWLDSLGPVASWNVSELGLEFDDGRLLMEQWIDAGWLSPESRAPIEALDSMLEEMSGEGNAALWTREALSQHEAWRKVRTLAMSALCTFA